MARLVFHIDVNSAFLSWEATRRVSLGEEDIRLIPSAIGGDRDKRTGVILPSPFLPRNSVSRLVSPWPWHCVNARICSWPDRISVFMKNPPGPSWTSAGNTHQWSRNTPSTNASWTCPVPIRSIRIQSPLPIPSRTRSEIHWDLL